MYRKDPEKEQRDRQEREPSNFEIISAFARSDHLKLYKVGNTAREILPVLSSSRRNACIIAKFANHILRISNASFYEVNEKAEFGSGLRKAIDAGVPGVIWIRNGYVIMRDKVFYDRDYVPPED
jgi:hypothetical protein